MMIAVISRHDTTNMRACPAMMSNQLLRALDRELLYEAAPAAGSIWSMKLDGTRAGIYSSQLFKRLGKERTNALQLLFVRAGKLVQ